MRRPGSIFRTSLLYCESTDLRESLSVMRHIFVLLCKPRQRALRRICEKRRCNEVHKFIWNQVFDVNTLLKYWTLTVGIYELSSFVYLKWFLKYHVFATQMEIIIFLSCLILPYKNADFFSLCYRWPKILISIHSEHVPWSCHMSTGHFGVASWIMAAI